VLDPTVVDGASGAIVIDVKAGAPPVTVTTTEDTSEPEVAVIVVVPIFDPVKSPVVELIVPIAVFPTDHVTSAEIGLSN
jgi:hypothetical protein